MESSKIEIITARMAGYLDALSSTTRTLGDYQSFAFCEGLDVRNINASISEFYARSCETLKRDFPDMGVAPFVFEEAEVMKSWNRKLHMELEYRLLPKPMQDLFRDSSALKDIKFNIAWQVMEMIRMVSDEFESEVIFKIPYRRESISCGVVFVIPLKDTCLVFRFGVPPNA